MSRRTPLARRSRGAARRSRRCARAAAARRAPPLRSPRRRAASRQTTPGIEVGPPPPASSEPTRPHEHRRRRPGEPARPSGTCPGGCARRSTTGSAGSSLDALTPMLAARRRDGALDAAARRATRRSRGLWQISLIAADALLVLFVLVAAGLAMSHETLQSQLRAQGPAAPARLRRDRDQREPQPRRPARRRRNALAAAFLGDGATAAATARLAPEPDRRGALGRRHLPRPARARLRRRRGRCCSSSTCCARRSWSCSSAPRRSLLLAHLFPQTRGARAPLVAGDRRRRSPSRSARRSCSPPASASSSAAAAPGSASRSAAASSTCCSASACSTCSCGSRSGRRSSPSAGAARAPSACVKAYALARRDRDGV